MNGAKKRQYMKTAHKLHAANTTFISRPVHNWAWSTNKSIQNNEWHILSIILNLK